MHAQTHLLNPRGLLAAMVAMALSGPVLAETAGKVNFVIGKVVAVAQDGSQRVLSKGDAVNSGERIETGQGRVQLRFTDGSFLALQPDTVFGLDQYTYSRAKPEEGSLLFNFVRGSMRTVSGAIGKVNRANYKVKTPVATIGIRGTGYAGRIHNGTLLVSVSHGMVNISNNLGNSNVSSGQTFITRPGEAPQPAPANETAGARAEQPQGKGDVTEQKKDSASPSPAPQTADTGATAPRVTQSEQVNSSGQTLVDSTVQPSYFMDSNATTKTPAYTLATLSPVNQNAAFSGAIVGASAQAAFQDGAVDNNAVLTLKNNNQFLLTRDTAQTVNLTNRGSLSFGEWTNGVLSTLPPDSSVGSLSPVTLDQSTFVPYIVGVSGSRANSTAANGDFQRVTFTHDAGLVRSGSDVGTINTLTLTIDLAATASALLDLKVTMRDGVYQASGAGLGQIQGGNGRITSLSGRSINVSGADCAANGCLASLSAFFAGQGDEIGAIFQIQRSTLGSINGVDRLVQTGQTTVNLTPSFFPNSNATSKTPTYTLATFSPVNQNAASSLILADSALGQFQTGAPGVNNSILQITDAASGTVLLKAGTAQTVNLTNTGSLSFGEWTNGTLNVISQTPVITTVTTAPSLTTVTLDNKTFIPYVIGYESFKPLGYLGNGSTATQLSYSLDKGIVRSGAEIGALNTFNMRVILTPTATAEFDIAMTMADGVYQTSGARVGGIVGTGTSLYGLGSDGLFNLSGTSCPQTGCPIHLTGFFSQNGANDQFGTLIQVDRTGAANITGAASLTNTGSATVKQYVPDGSNYSGLFLETQSAPLTRALADDQENGALQGVVFRTQAGENGGLDIAKVGSNNFGSASTQSTLTEVNHYKGTLSWGKWSSGTAAVNGLLYTLGNGDGSSIVYMVGIPASAAPLANGATSAIYSFAGGTQPVAMTGSANSPSTLTGSILPTSNITLNFGASTTAALQLDLNMGGQAISATGAPTAVSGTAFGWNTLAVNGCTAGCGGTAAGFFAGSDASLAALKYSVDSRGITSTLTGTINGVAAFDRNPIK